MIECPVDIAFSTWKMLFYFLQFSMFSDETTAIIQIGIIRR